MKDYAAIATQYARDVVDGRILACRRDNEHAKSGGQTGPHVNRASYRACRH